MDDNQPDNQPEGQPAQKRGRGLGRPFQKGQSGNPSGVSKELEPTRGSVFLDMQAVYEQPPSEDRTAGEKNCRKWLDDNPKEFMRELLKHRELEILAQRPAEVPEGKDERQEKIEDLIASVLREIGYPGAGHEAG